MKRVLLGFVAGLFLGWLTVPIAKATYAVNKSDGPITNQRGDSEDFTASHAYKWYLNQILFYMKQMNDHLVTVDENIRLMKEKLHA